MIDFEIAPATTGRAGTFAFNQSMVYWNTTDQDGKFADYNVGGLGLSTANTWKMVTMTLTGDEIAFYSNGQKINHTVSSGSVIPCNLTGRTNWQQRYDPRRRHKDPPWRQHGKILDRRRRTSG